MSDIIQRVGEKIGDHMDEIVRLFKPGAKITVIVRQPSVPDHSQDLILTSDDLDSAIAALKRRKNPVGTNEARV